MMERMSEINNEIILRCLYFTLPLQSEKVHIYDETRYND